MTRTALSSKTMILVAALAIALAAAALVFTLPKPIPVPVTSAAPASAAETVSHVIDPVYGSRLRLEGGTSLIDVPEMRTTDLGAGYVLETNGMTGRITAPEAVLKPEVRTTDLGAGYKLETNGASGHIVAPESPIKSAALSAPAEATTMQPPVRMVDLGNGYWLVVGPEPSRTMVYFIP